ncbi:LptA/OstA family protein [Geitlerinema sp. PCC 7407]|uniref:LptA/OstA family protein n=1 Tax=Geitlerinema sp. PCC 7407 TaxID=1173025 RepID=UPI00029F90E3|nr:OstA family protein [Geitlerinema sp. PCC 7407]
MLLSSTLLSRIMRPTGLALLLPAALSALITLPSTTDRAIAQAAGPQRSLTLRSDIQEANAKTGVVTARGNVQIDYPARQIQATASQAQYFSRERRIVLSGNVYILQEGNSLRGETVTYLIDEGRFVALPDQSRQVESIYLVNDANLEVDPGPSAPPPEVQAPPPVFSPDPVFAPSGATSTNR